MGGGLTSARGPRIGAASNLMGYKNAQQDLLQFKQILLGVFIATQ